MISECHSLALLTFSRVILLGSWEGTHRFTDEETKAQWGEITQDHTAGKQQSGNSEAGLPFARAHAGNQYAFLPPFTFLDYDLIFSLCKFVSLMWAVSKDRKVENSNSARVDAFWTAMTRSYLVMSSRWQGKQQWGETLLMWQLALKKEGNQGISVRNRIGKKLLLSNF